MKTILITLLFIIYLISQKDHYRLKNSINNQNDSDILNDFMNEDLFEDEEDIDDESDPSRDIEHFLNNQNKKIILVVGREEH